MKSIAAEILRSVCLTAVLLSLTMCARPTLETVEGRSNLIPSPPANTPRVETTRWDQLVARIQQIAQQEPGAFHIEIEDYAGGRRFGIAENSPAPTGSLYKLGVMAAVFAADERGRLSLDQPVTVKKQHFQERDPYFDPEVGSEFTVRELVKKMITVSSNVAALALLDLVSYEDVNAELRILGLTDTTLRKPIDNPSLPRLATENVSTSRDLATFYRRLLEGTVVSRAASAEMIEILKRQEFDDWLPRYLPKNAQVAHKTGTLEKVANNAGVIFTPQGPVIVSVMIWPTDDVESAVVTIARIGEVVWNATSVQ